MLGRDVVQLVSTAQLWAYQVGTDTNLSAGGTHNY